MPASKPTLAQILAAVLLPPLAVFLARGIGPAFWVSVVLTILSWLPGVIFALVVIFVPDRLPGALRQG